MNTKILGNSGESKAERFLKGKGLEILQRNYHNSIGEIDLICYDKKQEEIVFVEVKTRSGLSCGNPLEAVTPQKQNKIQKTALVYLKTKRKLNDKFRFDVIGILGEEIIHIEYAF